MEQAAAEQDGARIRFIGLDVHKKYAVAAGVDERQHIVLNPHRIELNKLINWAAKALQPTDVVVLEAMWNTWEVYDQLRPLVAAVVVANPARTSRMKEPGVKTDAGDAVFLARLLASGMLPTVWVPPVAARELRSLVSHRHRLIAQRTRTRNRLHSMLLRHGIELPPGIPFSAEKRDWWENLPVSPTEQLQVRHNLVMLDGLTPLIAEAEIELFRLSQQEPWRDQVVFLVQLPGVQVLTAMVLLAAIGDIKRFTNDRLLVGYAGLGTTVHDSGETHRQGHITKRGRRELRTTMVEAAWSAIRWHPFWKAEFKRLVEVKHLNRKVATIAIARRLLVVVWHVLSKREADRQAIPDGVARKFMVWAYRIRQTGQPAKTATFVRAELSRLGLLTPSTVQLGSHVLNFATSGP